MLDIQAGIGQPRKQPKDRPHKRRVVAGLCCNTLNPDFAVAQVMKPSQVFDAKRASIRSVVEAHRACNARVFGSVARGEDIADSDIDILVDPTPETTLFDLGAIRHELSALLGVPVDVLTPNALPDKFRSAVLAQARPI